MPKTSKRIQRPTVVRQDGLETRRALLDAAGQIFAEQGYARATSKDICTRANANIAAVNYHFGSKDGLYAAVLEEAHSRIVSIETLTAAAKSRIEPRLKLKMFLQRIVAEACKSDRDGWELRVLSRELLSRSPMMSRLVENQIAPKAKIVRSVLAELMQLPADDPAISRVVLNLMGPFLMLLITDRSLQKQVAPKLELDADVLTEHMYIYALAGIAAVAKERKKTRK